MNSWIDVKGASGSVYRYQLAERAKPRTAVSGTYIYVREAGPTALEIVYAGQALNLSEEAPELFQKAASEYGATHLFTRLNVASAAREAELSDLLAAGTPPMNEAASHA